MANLENLKAGNVQDADERGSLALCPVEGFVDAVHEPAEQPLICGFGKGLHGELCLLLRLGLLHVVTTHLDAGGQDGASEVRHVDAKEVAHLLRS